MRLIKTHIVEDPVEYHYVMTVQCANDRGGFSISTRSGLVTGDSRLTIFMDLYCTFQKEFNTDNVYVMFWSLELNVL